MLRYLRENQKTFLWILLAFITVPFVVYYGASPGGNKGGQGQQALAGRVNEEPVYYWQYAEVRDQYQRQLEQRGRVTAAQQRQIDKRAFDDVVDRELLLQQAAKLGIQVTPAEVTRACENFFQQLHRQFQQQDPSVSYQDTVAFYLSRSVRGNDLETKERIFREEQRVNLLQQKMYQLPSYGTLVSEEDAVREVHRREDKARVQYLLFDRQEFVDELSDTEPSEEELRAWFDDHRDDYKKGAQVKVRYARFRATDFEDEALAEITPEVVQREFNNNSDKYGQAEPEKRRIDFVTFAADKYIQDASYTEAEITNWYETHKDDYMSPEKARVRFVVLKLDDLKDKVNISESDIEDYYKTNIKRYVKEPGVELSHILASAAKVTTPEKEAAAKRKIEEAQTRLAAGEDFNKLAAEISDDPGSATGYLGVVTPSSGYVEAFKKAGLALAEGEVTAEPVRTEFGYHLIKAGKHIPGSTRTLAEVRNEIVDALTREREKSEAMKELRALRNRLDGGLTQENVGDDFTVYETVAFTRNEREPVDANIGRSDMWQFASRAFDLDVGELSQVVQGEKADYLMERTAKIESEPQTLDDAELRRTIIAELTDNISSKLAQVAANKSMRTIEEEGLSLRDVAASEGMEFHQSTWLGKNDFNVQNIGPNPTDFLKKVFEAETGQIVIAVGPDGSAHLTRIEAIRPEKTPKFDDLDTRTVNRITDALVKKSASLLAQKAAARFLGGNLENHNLDETATAFESLGPNIMTGVTGYITTGSEIDGLGFVPELTDAALTLSATGTEPGTWYDMVIEDQGGTQYVIELVDSRPEGIPPFDEIREDVLKDYQKEQAADLARLEAEKALKSVKEAMSSGDVNLAAIADANGYELRTANDLSRSNAYLEGVGNSPRFAKVAFDLAVGQVSGIVTIDDPFAPSDDGEPSVRAYAILKVLSQTIADDDTVAEKLPGVRKELERKYHGISFRAWLDGIRANSKIEDLRESPQA